MQGKNRIINIRTNIFTILIFLVFGLIISRLFYLQILYGKEYKREGDNQYFYDTGENFDRGSIFFANKSGINSPAVEMTNEYDINIDPKTINLDFQKKMTEGGENIDDLKNNFYYSIQKVFDKYNSENNLLSNASNTKSFINKDIFMEKLNQKDSSFEVLEKGVEEDIANDLIGLGLRGLIIARKKSRVYFEKDIAAKILGFVGYAGDKKTGIYGIEKYYNDVLEKNAISSKNFFAEVFSDFNSDENIDKRKNLNYDNDSRGDINLTIDINLERYLDGILKNTKEKWNSEKIGGIIMDINDGSILAMDELPSFDANDYKNVEDVSFYNNDLVSGVYEMGSIIKPLTIAAAIDDNTVNENTVYDDKGFVSLDGYKIWNYDKRSRGPNTPLQQILSQSLNVGIAFVVEKMGGDELANYFKKYGLGDYTGIDLPNESSGLVANLSSHVMVDSVTAGFGQGIAITPIQTIRALATLGNGGKLVTPHVVQSITYDDGDTKNIIMDDPIEIFDQASTSKRISNILINVVDDAMHMKNPKYTIAAKTGTAQMVNPESGRYYDDRYLHSFFGYFPATNPKYIIFLYQVYPKGAEYASQTLKEAFFNLVNYVISYYEIQPDR